MFKKLYLLQKLESLPQYTNQSTHALYTSFYLASKKWLITLQPLSHLQVKARKSEDIQPS